MATYGLSIDEILELTITQFLLYTVEVVEVMKLQKGASGGSTDAMAMQAL